VKAVRYHPKMVKDANLKNKRITLAPHTRTRQRHAKGKQRRSHREAKTTKVVGQEGWPATMERISEGKPKKNGGDVGRDAANESLHMLRNFRNPLKGLARKHGGGKSPGKKEGEAGTKENLCKKGSTGK